MGAFTGGARHGPPHAAYGHELAPASLGMLVVMCVEACGADLAWQHLSLLELLGCLPPGRMVMMQCRG